MFLRFDTEAINKDIPIKDVIERYAGIRTDRRGNIVCPAPDHNDSHPSAKIYEHSNTCHCFSCQSNFNPISLAKEYHPEMKFPDLCKKLLDDFGLSMENYSNINEVRRFQEYSKKNEFTDIFPLEISELKYIGLNNANGSRMKIDYGDEAYEPRTVTAPSLQQLWKEDKVSVETMLLSKCDETKLLMQKEIEHLNDIIDTWNGYSENKKMWIQKTLEAVKKYHNELISKRIKLTDEQKFGVEIMLEKDEAPRKISHIQNEMIYVDGMKQKILLQQAERAKHQEKQSHKKKHSFEKE